MKNKHESAPILRFPRNPPWWNLFHSFEDFEKARPISFAIDGFLQNDAATMIAAPSTHGKTLVLLSMVRALLRGTKLWSYFDVLETASRVIYLIPESTITPFKHRLKLFDLYDYLGNGRLLVHTLSKGPTPDLSDPMMLAAAKGAHIFLDPTIRFEEGNENLAGDNQRGMADRIFGLLAARARVVVAAHHSPKSFVREKVMTLENVVRGSGDIGAMVSTVWGIKQLDSKQNIIHFENVKPRDFEPCGPFQLVGRPYIDEEGDFRMHKKPGECGLLQDEQKSYKGGASPKEREQRRLNKKLLGEFLQDDPKATSKALARRFKQEGITLDPGTIRRYRAEIQKERA
jgi:hypothetical protein